ncbi:hypothetical protein P9112_005331 [Eukaryota sp. TZLM1-RC]
MRFLTLATIVAVLMALVTPTTASVLSDARHLYRHVENNERIANQLLKLTNKQKDPLLRAYNGVAKAILASFKWNPYTKLKMVKEGLALMNDAAKKDSTDIEIRLLRYSTEVNLPGIVPVDKHLDEDKSFMKKHYDPQHPMADVIDHFLNL